MTLGLFWTFMSLLSAVSALTTLYPSINGSETLSCECPDYQCQKVFWYRLRRNINEGIQFLVFCNSANTVSHATGISSARFKATTSSGSKVIYTLRITDINTDDAGLYSCMFELPKYALKSLKTAGYDIRPGEQRPTLPPPTTVKSKKKTYTCKSNSQPVKGCKPLVLWPCVGVLLVLAVVLILTLYYYSRLPKKCRHQFAKKMQLN